MPDSDNKEGWAAFAAVVSIGTGLLLVSLACLRVSVWSKGDGMDEGFWIALVAIAVTLITLLPSLPAVIYLYVLDAYMNRPNTVDWPVEHIDWHMWLWLGITVLVWLPIVGPVLARGGWRGISGLFDAGANFYVFMSTRHERVDKDEIKERNLDAAIQEERNKIERLKGKLKNLDK